MNLASSTNRPRSVTLTLWGVFLLGVWNFGRALALGQQRVLLQELGAHPDPTFRLIVALVWGIVFFGLGDMLRRKRPFTRRLIPLSIFLYALYEMGLIILFAAAAPARQSLLLDALLVLSGVLFSGWALNRTAVYAYFTSASDLVRSTPSPSLAQNRLTQSAHPQPPRQR